MRGRGGDVGDLDRARIESDRDEAGDMSHVHEKVGTHFIGDSSKALPNKHPGVRRKPRNDQRRPMLACQRFDLLVVDFAAGRI